MLVGITGKSGSGKGHFARQLGKLTPSWIHVDIDKIAHEVLLIDEVKEEIKRAFNIELTENNRKELGEMVFNNRKNHGVLANITWRFMEEKIDKIINSNKYGYNHLIILDWILLPKTKYFSMCDQKYLMIRNEEIRIKSVMDRDNIPMQYLVLRDSNAMEYDETMFDYVIRNLK